MSRGMYLRDSGVFTRIADFFSFVSFKLVVMFFFRKDQMLLTSRGSQLISSPETHSVQSSSLRPFQHLIWVLLSKMKPFYVKYLTHFVGS